MSYTAELFGLAGITILEFIGLLWLLEWCTSVENIGWGRPYSWGSDIPGTSDCIGDIQGCNCIPVGPCEGAGKIGWTCWFGR